MNTTLERGQAATILAALGHHFTTEPGLTDAIAVFQAANRLDAERLVIDGAVGPRTSRLLALADARRRRGEPTLSPHFSWAEFACRCAGHGAGCRGQLLHGALVDAYELLRSVAYRDGLAVVSGYRCPDRNAATRGSASGSQHQWGAGGDIPPRLKVAALVKLGVASGIGYSPSTGLVVHLDVRGRPAGAGRLAEALRSPNGNGGTLTRPTIFPDGK